MKICSLLLLLIPLVGFTQAPDLNVPQEILDEMETVKVFDDDSTMYAFRVVKPKVAYDTTLIPVTLCLSGGNQAPGIVDYCYAAWFRSSRFDGSLMIIPLNTTQKNLRNFTPEDIEKMIAVIKKEFKTYTNDWTILGSSNGGLATYKFIANEPSLYRNVITMPGMVAEGVEVTDAWSHLAVTLAYGGEDSKFWKDAIKSSELILKQRVHSLKVYEMEDMPHILPLYYDIDNVYNYHFKVDE